MNHTPSNDYLQQTTNHVLPAPAPAPAPALAPAPTLNIALALVFSSAPAPASLRCSPYCDENLTADRI